MQAHERLRALLRGDERLGARGEGGRAPAVPHRGSGASARRARWSWARCGAIAWAIDQQGHRGVRARAGDRPGEPGGAARRWRACTPRPATASAWSSPTRSCWSTTQDNDDRRRLMLEIAEPAENQLGDPRAGLRVVPARLQRDAGRRERCSWSTGVAERHGLFDELIQVYEGARARATDPDRAAGGVAEDRPHLRGEAGRSARARSRCCATRCPPTRRGASCCPTSNGWPRATDDWHGLLDVYARVARAPPRDRATGSSCCACAPRCASARWRSVGRARRVPAQLRARARRRGDAGGDPAPGARHRPLGRRAEGRGAAVRAGGGPVREAVGRAQRRLPGRTRGQGSACAPSAPT